MALTTVSLAVGGRLVLDPILGERVPYASLLAVLLPLALLVNPAPFLAAGVLGVLASRFLFVTPRYTFGTSDSVAGAQLGLATLAIAAAGLTAWLSQRAGRRARNVTIMQGAFVDESPLQIWVMDASGRLVYANRALAHVLNRPVDQLLFRTYGDLIPADTAAEMALADRQVIATGQPMRAVTALNLQGGTQLFEWRRFPLRLEASDTPLVGGMAFDVTDHHRVAQELCEREQALKARVEELKAILDIAPVQIWFGDARCQALYGNRRGYEEHRLTPDSNASFDAPVRELPEGLRLERDGVVLESKDMPMQIAARTGQPVENFEHDVVHPDGRRQTLSASVQPLFNPDGTVRGVVGVYIDLTESKRLEAALRQADRRKDIFLATLAHELRNPLAPIRNAVEVLKMRSPPDTDLAWCCGVIDRQASRMARLLDDLLDVSRITHGRLELRREWVSLTAVVHGALELSRPLLDGGNHPLTLDLPTEPLELMADPLRLAQVLANLLNNAAKYSDAGAPIRLAARREADQLVIEVQDEGVGIRPEIMPEIFGIFTQDQATLHRAQGGLGIGLALVKGLVELHGGTVEARSYGPGRGSEFVVRLPTSMDRAAAGVRTAAQPGAHAAPASPASGRY